VFDHVLGFRCATLLLIGLALAACRGDPPAAKSATAIAEVVGDHGAGDISAGGGPDVPETDATSLDEDAAAPDLADTDLDSVEGDPGQADTELDSAETSPELADTSADNVDAGPDLADAEPDNLQTGPELADTVADNVQAGPDLAETAPDGAQTGPDLADWGADNVDAAPDIADASLDGSETGPGLADTVQDSAEAGPGLAEIAPDGDTSVPDVPDVAPASDAGAPEIVDASCSAKSCKDLGLACGSADNGCGGQLACGTCALPQVCGGTGLPGQCAVFLAPDPTTVVPPLSQTAATSPALAWSFLWQGLKPVQFGVQAGALDPTRVARLTGRAWLQPGSPAGGVTVSIVGRPDLGVSSTRGDGRWDLVVPAGGAHVVRFHLAGHLPIERRAEAPAVHAVVEVPDVGLTPLQAKTTQLALPQEKLQVVQGSPIKDLYGKRTPVLLVPAGTQAKLVLQDGTKLPLPKLTVRMTEYNTGHDGPHALPGALPPQVGYSTALAFTVDEALAVGAVRVEFTPPLVYVNEDYIGLLPGTLFPTATYDPQRAAWTTDPSGTIVKVLSVAGGTAQVGLDTSQQPAGPAALAKLGISDAERVALAGLYAAGQGLWRRQVAHFSGSLLACLWDNPPGSGPPATPAPGVDGSGQGGRCESGSLLLCERQALVEHLPVAGTPYSLVYASDRVPGRKAAYRLQLRLTHGSPSNDLKAVHVSIAVAGQTHHVTLAAKPELTYEWTWDGKDGWGRPVAGEQPAHVGIGYNYNPYYFSPQGYQTIHSASAGSGIGGGGGVFQVTYLSSQTAVSWPYVLWQRHVTSLGAWDARLQGLGGWALDVHHAYNPAVRRLHAGDGVSQAEVPGRIRTLAGAVQQAGVQGSSAENVLATDAELPAPWGVAADAAGNVYFGDTAPKDLDNTSAAPPGAAKIRRVDANGKVTTVATVQSWTLGLALDPGGSLIVAGHTRVLRVDPSSGIVTAIAGTGVAGFGGDFGPATAAKLNGACGVAADAYGRIYIADMLNHRIRVIDPAGTIRTWAGMGFPGFSGDGSLAGNAELNRPHAVAVDPSGWVYIADTWNHRIRRVSPGGNIVTVAGTGSPAGALGDGGPAPLARLEFPMGLAVSPDRLYVADLGHRRVRSIDSAGTITTAAGDGAQSSAATGWGGDGSWAHHGQLDAPYGLGLDATGAVLVVDRVQRRIRQFERSLPAYTGGALQVPDPDGALLHDFDAQGRLLATIDAFTGAVVRTFGYDAAGRLAAVTDAVGQKLTIQRDPATGQATALQAPTGEITQLQIGADGWLGKLTAPDQGVVQLTYGAGGLLTGLKDPLQKNWTFGYDALGRLTSDAGPDGSGVVLQRQEAAQGHTVTSTSAAGHKRTYTEDRQPGGKVVRTFQDSAGLLETRTQTPDSGLQASLRDGSQVTTTTAADPRLGAQAAYVNTAAMTVPGGGKGQFVRQRTATPTVPLQPLQVQTIGESAGVPGALSTNLFSVAKNESKLQSPAGRTVTIQRDAKARLAAVQVGALFPVKYEYDPVHGRLRFVRQGQGAAERVMELQYDAKQRLVKAVDPLGQVLTIDAWDAARRPLQTTLPGGRVLGWQWDPLGRLVKLTPPGKPAHGFESLPHGQLASETAPDVGQGPALWTRTYDKDRRLKSWTFPGGETLAVARDGAGRVSTLTWPNGLGGQAAVTFGYDAKTGQAISLVTADGTAMTQAWNGPLQMATTWAGVGSVGRAYASDLVPQSWTVAGASGSGVTVAIGLDQDDLVVQAGDLKVERQVDTGLAWRTTLDDIETERTFDGFGQMVEYVGRRKSTGQVLYSWVLTPDKLGRVATLKETVLGTSIVWTYEYDQAERLWRVHKDGALLDQFTYDANNNRTSRLQAGVPQVATFDDRDRVLTDGPAAYAHTPDGRRTTRTTPNGKTTYAYDVLGNLRQFTPPAGPAVSYVIDGNNRRIAKKVGGVLQRSWLYGSQLRVVGEVDAQGGLARTFVHATFRIVPDYVVAGSNRHMLLVDPLGSPRLVVDSSTGAVVQRLDYDAWGRVVQDTAPGFQPFGFAGGLYDPSTGLVRFGARDYDPDTGRFTTRDPLGVTAGANVYAYAGADPINQVDPSGAYPLAGPDMYQMRHSVDPRVQRIIEHVASTDRMKAALSGSWKYKPFFKGAGTVRNFMLQICHRYGWCTDVENMPKLCWGISDIAQQEIQKAAEQLGVEKVTMRSRERGNHDAVEVTFRGDPGHPMVFDWHQTLDADAPKVQPTEVWDRGNAIHPFKP